MLELVGLFIFWLSSGVLGYLLARLACRRFSSWTVGDRKLGLFFIITGPLFIVMGLFGLLMSIGGNPKNEEESSW